jgi:acetolactate synthase-1/2/3 large subunit
MLRSYPARNIARAALRQQSRCATRQLSSSPAPAGVAMLKKGPAAIRNQATAATASAAAPSPAACENPRVTYVHILTVTQSTQRKSSSCVQFNGAKKTRFESFTIWTATPRDGRVVRLSHRHFDLCWLTGSRFIGKSGGEIFHEMMLRQGVKHVCEYQNCSIEWRR